MCRRSTQTLHTRARNTADFSSKLPARTKRRRAVVVGFAHVGPSRPHAATRHDGVVVLSTHVASASSRAPVLQQRRVKRAASKFSLSLVSLHSLITRGYPSALFFHSPSPTDNERSFYFFLLFSRLCLIFSRVLAPNLAPVALKLGSGASFGALFISACSAPPEILSSRSSRRASRARRACSSSPTRCRTTRRA